MSHKEKQITYTTENTYSTLNDLSSDTKNVWIVLHGIGYLSKYFIKYFDQLPANENYIISPQAPSKYYLKNEFKHVGASWLTRVSTAQEISNLLNYLDAVLEAEQLPSHINLIVFGYSQGVSVALRWVALNQLKCNQLVGYSGGIPKELNKEDFEFLKQHNTKIDFLVGDQDEFITEEIRQVESGRIKDLFDGTARQIVFSGKHEIKKELLKNLV